jgi:hypothetical protein
MNAKYYFGLGILVLIVFVSSDMGLAQSGVAKESCVVLSVEGSVMTASCPGGVVRSQNVGAETGYYKAGDRIQRSDLGVSKTGATSSQQSGVRQDRPARDLSYPPYPGVTSDPGVPQNPGVPQSPGVQPPQTR